MSRVLLSKLGSNCHQHAFSQRLFHFSNVRSLNTLNLGGGIGILNNTITSSSSYNRRRLDITTNVVKQQLRFHGDCEVAEDAATVSFSFIGKKDEEIPVEAKVGQNLLRVAQKNDVELEGACECSIACSTCHVILEPEFYDTLEEASEDEEDMLDMAFGLTETSRLGCQILISEEMEGTKVELPKATRNFYVDGHVPEPH